MILSMDCPSRSAQPLTAEAIAPTRSAAAAATAPMTGTSRIPAAIASASSTKNRNMPQVSVSRSDLASETFPKEERAVPVIPERPAQGLGRLHHPTVHGDRTARVARPLAVASTPGNITTGQRKTGLPLLRVRLRVVSFGHHARLLPTVKAIGCPADRKANRMRNGYVVDTRGAPAGTRTRNARVAAEHVIQLHHRRTDRSPRRMGALPPSDTVRPCSTYSTASTPRRARRVAA